MVFAIIVGTIIVEVVLIKKFLDDRRHQQQMRQRLKRKYKLI